MKKLLSFVLLGAIVGCQTPSTEGDKKDANALSLGFDLNDLDTTVSPCEDFFQYTAGNWIKNNPIPETEARWGSFNELIERNNSRVKGLLDSIAGISEFEKGSYQQLVADLYLSGMDSNTVENKGLKGLEGILNKVSAIASVDDYLNVAIELKAKGITHPWGTYVGVDEKNSSAHLLQLSQSGLGMPDRDYYLKTDSLSESIKAAYRNHVSQMLELAGYEMEDALLAAIGIFDFEAQLAKVSMSRVERRNPENTYNKMSFDAVVAMAPNLRLASYFESNNMKFDTAVVNQPDYIKAMDSIMAMQSGEVLKNYAFWCTINQYANYLPAAFVNQDFDFYSRTLRGSKKIKPRWKRVLSTVQGTLGEPLGHLYVDKYFPESSKQDIKNMVEDLRTAYKVRVTKLDWMGEETKKKAIEKLDGFTYKIGYPDTWKDFAGLEIEDGNYLQNVMNLSAYGIKENLAKLNKEVDRSEWFMPAHIVNAYYNPANNEVVFPAGILQPPFYDPSAEAAVNYGGIGGVIGHEFSHGFDDNGAKYNKEGNLENWWTAEDSTLFSARTTALAAQYSAYEPLPGIFVNGQLTLGENIADLGGLTLAYHAYAQSLENGREDVVIDGFTWQQRIFLGWAQVWQTNQTDAYLRNQVTTDPHSPAMSRVNGPTSNMDEFRAAWGCTDADKMVNTGEQQVKIW